MEHKDVHIRFPQLQLPVHIQPAAALRLHGCNHHMAAANAFPGIAEGFEVFGQLHPKKGVTAFLVVAADIEKGNR